MKKNLITVVILAISIINLVFNILLVFVFMPSTSKTNKLITDIAEVLEYIFDHYMLVTQLTPSA